MVSALGNKDKDLPQNKLMEIMYFIIGARNNYRNF